MGRIRTIKPEFWTDEELSELPAEVHLLAAALLNYADDEGYFNANPKLVKAACCPLREDSLNIHGALTELSNIGYLALGKCTSDSKVYGMILGFAEHQRVNRPTTSKIKGLPILWEDSMRTHGGLTEDSLLERKGKEGNGAGDESPARHTPKFNPPTVEAVRSYVTSRGSQVDPQRFVDFYASKGWMVGKNRMKDWQAAVRTWEKDAKPNGQAPTFDPMRGAK